MTGKEPHERGMILMAMAMLIVPGIDAFAKLLVATISAGEIATSRFLLQALFLLPIVWWQRPSLTGLQPSLQVLRGALIGVTTILFFAALRYMPLADAIAIFFVEPLILTLLSPWLLGEQVGWRRYAAVAVGLSGAVIIIRPGLTAFGPAALLPLLAATCFALYLVLTRRLAQTVDPYLMQFTGGISAFAVLSIALMFGTTFEIAVLTFVWPNAREILLMLGLGIVGCIGHLLIVAAFARAPASLLAPFQYLEIISATLLGLIIFGDFPAWSTWVGMAIIISAGLYVFHRERRRAEPL